MNWYKIAKILSDDVQSIYNKHLPEEKKKEIELLMEQTELAYENKDYPLAEELDVKLDQLLESAEEAIQEHVTEGYDTEGQGNDISESTNIQEELSNAYYNYLNPLTYSESDMLNIMRGIIGNYTSKKLTDEQILELAKDSYLRKKDIIEKHKRVKVASLRGEWWIINGQALFADSNIGDMGHEAYVLDHVRHEIAETMDFGGDIYDWNDIKQEILKNLIKTEEVDPTPLIQQYGNDFIEQIPYKPQIFDDIARNEYNISQEQLDIADGSGDIRGYGMKNMGWKRMAGNNIETQTLTENDLKDICRGIGDAFQDEEEVNDDTKFNIEIQGNGKVFWDIPLSIMESGINAVIEHGDRGMINTPTYAKNNNWYKKAKLEHIEDVFEAIDEARDSILREFFYEGRQKGTMMSWSVVPFARLKKIWEDYVKLGFVRDEAGIEEISNQILKNLVKLQASTDLSGHSQFNPEELMKENGYELTEDKEDDFYWNFLETQYGTPISDFGLKPLWNLAQQLINASTAEQKLVIIDQMLNIVRQRGDLAALFIEGGTSSLTQLSAKPEEKTVEANNKIAKQIIDINDLPSVEEESDDKELEKAKKYFSIGHGDYDENVGYCPDFEIWAMLHGDIQKSKVFTVNEETGEIEGAKTHSMLWGQEVNNSYKGRYEPQTGKLTVVKPYDQMYRDIPKSIMYKIENAFPQATKIIIAKNNKQYKKAGQIIPIYRGEYSGNKGGGYYSTDKEFARQFTQSGRDFEIITRKIDLSKIYDSRTEGKELLDANNETDFDNGMKRAKELGLNGFRLTEGNGQPDSIYLTRKF